VVTYEKNVTYALAGVQDSDATLASHACGTACPGLRGTARERAAPLHPGYEPSSMGKNVIYACGHPSRRLVPAGPSSSG